MYGGTSFPKQGCVKVISRTGLYLETTDRWPIDEVISLTMQKAAASASDSEFQIDVQARVASCGEDGVGLEFMLPKGLNVDLWEHLIENADAPTESEDTQSIFRMVRAILFLYRLSPSTATEPIHVMTGELDASRTRNMLGIALTAERMLVAGPDAEKMRAHPSLITSVLKDGSWVDDDLAQQLWAGWLVSSCNPDGIDQSNKEIIELLVQLTTNQAHVLVEGCRRSSKQLPGPEGRVTTPVVISSEEMIRVTGITDLNRCATDVSLLHHHGLLEKNCDFSTYLTRTNFDITPTRLGMQFFGTCKGHLLTGAGISS